MSDSEGLTTKDYINMVDHLALLLCLAIFLIIKFMKYRTSNEKLKFTKENSAFSSIVSSPSSSTKPELDFVKVLKNTDK